MMWPVDTKSWLSVKEMDWDERRAEAARLRVFRRSAEPLRVLTWGFAVLERMYQVVRVDEPAGEPEIDLEFDAELERLFALLAPTGEVLHVERVPRRDETAADEELCCAECGSPLPPHPVA